MKKRTQQEWHQLFKQQAEGNLSITAFCKKHYIGQSSFYKQKKALSPQAKTHSPATFIKATLEPSQRTSGSLNFSRHSNDSVIRHDRHLS